MLLYLSGMIKIRVIYALQVVGLVLVEFQCFLCLNLKLWAGFTDCVFNEPAQLVVWKHL